MRRWWRNLTNTTRGIYIAEALFVAMLLGLFFLLGWIATSGTENRSTSHEIWCPDSSVLATTDPGSLITDGTTLKWTTDGKDRMIVGDKCYVYTYEPKQ